jgi:tetratricopeptide (TPR) repeat protein
MLYFFVSLLLLVLPLGAEEKWVRLRTANFEVYTPQGEKKARETALYFEQLREFFEGYWGTKVAPGTPVRIVLFGNEKQFEPYRPFQTAAGYFQHGIDRDWIAIGGGMQGWERLVCHEYTHLMVKQAGLDLPLWLNEGLAEIYSTFKPLGGKVQIGDLIPGHFYAVEQGWVPVKRLLEVKHGSKEYGGKDTAQFYAGAWGLTHMLMLNQENKKVFAPLLLKLIEGVPAEEALAGAGLTADKLDGELRNYLKRNSRFYAGLIPFKSEKSAAGWTAEKVSAVEVDAVLALLQMNNSKKRDLAKLKVGQLNAADWHSQEAMAYRAWLDRDMKLANEHFQEAMKLGATSAKLYYDAARAAMYSGERKKESVEYLKKAIELYPEWVDAKLQLMEQYLFLGQYAEAIGVSAGFQRIGTKEASRLFRGAAYAEAMIDGLERAKATQARARKYAKTEYDRMECDRIDAFLGRLAAAGERREQMVAAEVKSMRERADADEGVGYGESERVQLDLERPVIRRGGQLVESGGGKVVNEPGVSRMIVSEDSVEFVGTLVKVECGAVPPVLSFKGEKGEALELVMTDPKQVNLQILANGDKVKELELSCGEQSKRVKIRYFLPAEGRTRGDLRGIEYLN